MDKISRIYCESLKLRAYTVESKSTVRDIVKIHDTTPNATVALGRVINGAALLGATLKPESNQGLLLKFSGEGPIREIHAQTDAYGNIRAYVANPRLDESGKFDSINFSKAIGAGLITVIKDLGMKENYNSVTPILNGEVASDLAYYLTTSEQVPSAVIIGLNLNKDGAVTSSGGILIQTFPDTDPDVIEKIEYNINNMENDLGTRLEKGEDITSVVSELFSNEALQVLSTTPLTHNCNCSRELLLSTLKNVDKAELQDMIEKDNGAEITCTFCKKVYNFSEEDLKAML